jgi:hypothetical protein
MLAESSGDRNCCSKIVFGRAGGATVGGTSPVVPSHSGGSFIWESIKKNNASDDHG